MRWYGPNKYKNTKVVVDGITFDSKKEAARYKELKLLEAAGEIFNLERQVKFVLIPTQRETDFVGVRGGIKKGKVIEKECSYLADFVYIRDGEVIVEDVKGYKNGSAYNIFKIKRKLMLYFYGIKIQEI